MKREKGKEERGKGKGEWIVEEGDVEEGKGEEGTRERERVGVCEREKGKKEVRSANGRGSRRDRGREGEMDMERMATKSCSIICFEQIGLGRR